MNISGSNGIEIAIVGMAGRFPGADGIEAFWENICKGVESRTDLSDEMLRRRGVSSEALAGADYVRAGFLFDGFDLFDAEFFGYTPRDAAHLDPQQRIFLECAWEALEHAGYDALRYSLPVGVYAGAGPNIYLMKHLLSHAGLGAESNIAELLGLLNGNAADALCTRVAYKLNLRGPAVTVQTSCSTSLVAVHVACSALLGHECDMALAGGVWLNLLQDSGYRYTNGAILSPDGHCRAFDANAAGTVIGSGAGIVVLKRLEDALRDGDTIHAVIKGSAVNNDGADKIGYTAPGISGQTAAIKAAHAVADVPAESISYVEAHGTGTTLGDPIEIAALSQAFGKGKQRQFCAIGSVKTNVGHLDAAAGVTGLIKTVMALKHGTLPPSLNFLRPNPRIDFENSPFYVNTETRPWPASGQFRRAGVSSFGMGGTNAHVVLEEAPVPVPDDEEDGWQVLPISARSPSALQKMASRLASHIEAHPEQSLSDIACTLQEGRRAFAHRHAVVAKNGKDAVALLRMVGEGARSSRAGEDETPEVVFLFPGQGSQYADMGRAAYRSEPVFREYVDRCCGILQTLSGEDIRTHLFPDAGDVEEADKRLAQTALTQPALFVIEYAFAQLWMKRGVRPAMMLGHSVGEYVAACLSGVFSLVDALKLVAARGQLMQSLPAGAMTAVNLSEAEVAALPNTGWDLAAVNGEHLCVLSGSTKAIEQLEAVLVERGQTPRRLHVSHAFHSRMVEPVLEDFRQIVAGVKRHPPTIPFISNVSGKCITAEQACSPEYWVRHLRGTVRFHAGAGEALDAPNRVLLEVGPGETLSGLIKRHPRAASACAVLASQANARGRENNAEKLEQATAGLWAAGMSIDWKACHEGRSWRRVPLPAYPFERQSYWIEPASGQRPDRQTLPSIEGDCDIDDWFYLPVWKRAESLPMPSTEESSEVVLVYGEAHALRDCLLKKLRASEVDVVLIEQGSAFERCSADRYIVHPDEHDEHEHALRSITANHGPVSRIYYLWGFEADEARPASPKNAEQTFFSLLALIQALDTTKALRNGKKLRLTVAANQLADVTGIETLNPEKAALIGLCKVIPQEHQDIECRLIDIETTAEQSNAMERQVEGIIAEMEIGEAESMVAYRGVHRWLLGYEQTRRNASLVPRLRKSGTYLITGGLGGIGLALATYLAREWQARLVLLGRTALPPRETWQSMMDEERESSPLRTRLQTLLELETLGAQVLTVQADVTEPEQVTAALSQARQRFGVIHGVIHAAGDAGGGLITQKDAATAQRVLAPKVRGTRILLQQLLHESPPGEQPDFVMLCSSLAGIAGGIGKSDYAAANSCLDLFAAATKRQSATPVFSVDWDGWKEIGMSVGMRLPEHVGISASQGIRAFERIVNGADVPQIIVSTTELKTRLGSTGEQALLELASGVEMAARPSHPRPLLRTPYVVPQGDLEQGLAALWGEFLGIAEVGVNDDWFELGGDSLLAIQLVARLRGKYEVPLSPADLLSSPTIGGLAAAIESRLIEMIEAE